MAAASTHRSLQALSWQHAEPYSCARRRSARLDVTSVTPGFRLRGRPDSSPAVAGNRGYGTSSRWEGGLSLDRMPASTIHTADPIACRMCGTVILPGQDTIDSEQIHVACLTIRQPMIGPASGE